MLENYILGYGAYFKTMARLSNLGYSGSGSLYGFSVLGGGYL